MFWIPLMLAASTALSAGSQLMAGRAAKAGAQQQAAGAKIEAANYRLKSTQTAELSRERLRQTLSAQEVTWSTRGISGDSATAQAFEAKSVANAYRDEGIQRLSDLNGASAADSAAAGYTRAAKYAMPLAALGAASTLLKGGTQAYQAYKG